MNGFKNVVYVCKRCGFWKTAETPLEQSDAKLKTPLSDISIPTSKNIKQVCPDCKIRMKKYDKVTTFNDNFKSVIPKMACHKCGSLLKAGDLINWD